MSAPVPVCTAARSAGGQRVADICKVKRSITGAYLGRKYVEVLETRRPGNGKFLRVVKAHENNPQDITVDFPLGKMVHA